MAQPQQQANMLHVGDRPQKTRHRASVACAACRERRTRCVVPPGESQCTQCRDAGQDCIIKHDDERRKPNSKAYVNSLRDRIAQLETMLEEREQRQPTNEDPTKITPSDSSQDDDSTRKTSVEPMNFALPAFPPPDDAMLSSHIDIIPFDSQSPANSTISSGSSRSTMVHKLLSTRGHLSFDQLGGRLRYFGPTTNCHVYSEPITEAEENNRQALEQRRRTQRVLSTLPHDTQDYLMEMFWQYYNSSIHVIHQGAFEEGMIHGQGQFYSPFLHICILAMGYRHADKRRSDMIKISLPGKESTLHREAKYMLDYELERPGGITSIQALLLLGDLECGVGRDNLGWLISGMANRLCFDIGLHLDTSNSGLSQREIEIGRMTLWACVIYDKYWALFLGRPTALKPEDLEVYRLSHQFERLGALEPAGPTKSLEKQIYEALLDLMELAGKITEIMDKASKPNANLDQHVYIRMSALDRELETWYSRLPSTLQWTAENIEMAPFSFFLLHQQYHAAVILLHRQFAQYDEVTNTNEHNSEHSDTSQSGSHFSTLSRMTCTRSAGRMAQIFWQHRKRFDTRQIFVTGLQHAGTAAIALVAALASPKDRTSYDTNMQYLECLAAALQDMSETYQPAERMSAVLGAVLLELKNVQPHRQSNLVPARRGSSSDREDDDQLPSKRRSTSRPGPLRMHSQYTQSQNSLRDQPRRNTTTGTSITAPVSPFLSRSEKQLPFSSSNDGFIIVENDNTDITDEWPRFDGSNPFNIGDSLGNSDSAAAFGQPNSPSTFRSAWMGAETPSFSPLPSGPPASAFTNTNNDGISERHNPDNFNTNNTNLDFMALLNGTDRGDTNTGEIQNNVTFGSLPTPTSTPEVNGFAHTFGSSASVKKSTQKFGQASSAIGDTGFSQTMAGLDDIWKEMMRSNGSQKR